MRITDDNNILRIMDEQSSEFYLNHCHQRFHEPPRFQLQHRFGQETNSIGMANNYSDYRESHEAEYWNHMPFLLVVKLPFRRTFYW